IQDEEQQMKMSLMTFVLVVVGFAADCLMAQQPDPKSPRATARNTARALRRQLEEELRGNPTGCCADSELRAALENYLANDPLEKAISALKEVISQSPGSLDAAKAEAAIAALEANECGTANADCANDKCAKCQKCVSECPIVKPAKGAVKAFGDLFN